MRGADRVGGLDKGFGGGEGPFIVRMSIDPVAFLNNMSDLPPPLKSPMSNTYRVFSCEEGAVDPGGAVG